MYDLRKPSKYSEQYTLTGYCAKDHGKHETQLTNHPLALPRPTSSAAEHRKAQRPRSAAQAAEQQAQAGRRLQLAPYRGFHLMHLAPYG